MYFFWIENIFIQVIQNELLCFRIFHGTWTAEYIDKLNLPIHDAINTYSVE